MNNQVAANKHLFDILTIFNPSPTPYEVYYNSELYKTIQPGKAIRVVKMIGAINAEPVGGGDQGQDYVIYGPLGIDENYNMLVNKNGSVVFSVFGNTSLKTRSIIEKNNYYSVAGVLDGISNEMKIYVNGILEANKSYSDAYKGNDIPATTGAFLNGTSSVINGSIAELAIWKRALNEKEILNLYKTGVLWLNLSVKSCDDANCS